MNPLEERLREAYSAAADTVRPESVLPGGVQGLDRDGHPAARPGRRGRSQSPLLVPLAAAIAVTVVVGTVYVLGSQLFRGAGPQQQPKTLPAQMTGLPMPAGTNLRLLLAAAHKRTGKVQAAWYWTATRQTEPIAHLPAANYYFFFRVEGGWSAGAWRVGSAPGPPVRAYFIADGSLTATRIGAGFNVRPSDRAGAVWLVSYPRSTDHIATTSASAQLVSTTGQPLGPRYRLPAGYLPWRGVGNYLLLTSHRSRPRPPYVYELWDPRTGQVVRRMDNVIATGPDQIAWSPGCRGCQAQVLNVSTGKSMTIPIHGGQDSGAFSDDGRLLAVQLPNHGSCVATTTGSNCSGTDGALGVFDTETRAFTIIPGTALRFSEAMSFLWQNGGHRLIVLAAPGNSSSDTTQIAYWDPGDTRLRVATIQIPGGMGAVATAGPGQWTS